MLSLHEMYLAYMKMTMNVSLQQHEYSTLGGSHDMDKRYGLDFRQVEKCFWLLFKCTLLLRSVEPSAKSPRHYSFSC